MKKVIILCFIFIFSFLISCGKNEKQFSIITDVESYSPLSSSIQGITLSVNTNEKDENLEYYWFATDGTFKNSEKPEDTGKTVMWSIVPLDETSSGSVTITLTVKDKDTGKEIAKTSILLEKDMLSYTVR